MADVTSSAEQRLDRQDNELGEEGAAMEAFGKMMGDLCCGRVIRYRQAGDTESLLRLEEVESLVGSLRTIAIALPVAALLVRWEVGFNKGWLARLGAETSVEPTPLTPSKV